MALRVGRYTFAECLSWPRGAIALSWRRPGADQAIASAADQLGSPQIACPAAWQQYGRAAGPIRNRQMLERSLDVAAALPLGAGLLVIAFPGSRGTAFLVDQARRFSRRSAIPIEVLEIPAAA